MTLVRRAETRLVEMDALELGEGARWWPDGPVQVDLLAGRLIALGEPATVMMTLDVPVGAAAPRAGGGLALVAGTGVRLFADLDDRNPQVVETGLDQGTFRVNDAAVDAEGRLYFGVMSYDGRPGAGSLWRLDKDRNVRQVASGFGVPNGPVIDTNRHVLYLADSARGMILRYPFQPDTGHLGEPEVFATVTDGSPDGMAIDTLGGVWSALWGGARLHRYDPDGDLTDVVMLPTTQPTSLALDPLGGPAIVTSASYGLASPSPQDGRTMWVDLGVAGLPTEALNT